LTGYDQRQAMNFEYLIVGIIAFLVMLYLLYALMRPEKL
jgi:K+-transporting ATPase KdpF subunit